MVAGIVFGLLSLAFFLGMLRYAPRPILPPLIIFTVFYVITSALGATALAFPDIRDFWALMFPGLDQSWLDFGDRPGYWFIIWGPLFITTLVAARSYRWLRKPALACARVMRARIDVLPAAIVGFGLSVYCLVNLSQHGFLGITLLSGEQTGLYTLNIKLRADMFHVLGAFHFAAIYTGIPAIAFVAFHQAVRRRSWDWGVLFIALTLALCFLYISTLTKSNILIYGLETAVAAHTLGLLRLRGAAVAAAAGTLVLTVLSSLLSGTSPFDVLLTGYNIIFREASDVPFYLGVFPQQVPFVGIDLGLGGFGIGPTIATNEVVSNFMWPRDTWVQGAAPAAAHVMAYAEGGYWWSAVTMGVVGIWIGFTGALRAAARNPVTFSGFIGAVAVCYYMSQANVVGAFNVSYGYRWWLGTLLVLMALQRLLESALGTQREVIKWTNASQSDV